MKLIPAHLQASHWANQHSAILAIGMISAGCRDSIIQILNHLISTVVAFTASESPRLKWASVTTIGLLCSEYNPDLQNTYSSVIIKGVLECLSRKNISKVQIQASACMVNYAKGLLVKNSHPEIALIPYLDILVQQFLELLTAETSPLSLLQEVLNALAMIATSSGAYFAPYYSQLIHGLRTIVNMNTPTSAEKEVRAACIRCIGCIIESVGDTGETFKEDASTLLADFMRIRNAIDDSDPVYQAINEVLSYFASCLKERFAPYLQILIPMWERKHQ